MKTKLLAALLSATAFLCCLIGLSACTNTEANGTNKQVPVYTGMSVSNSSSVTKKSVKAAVKYDDKNYFGDSADGELTTDDDKPFENSDATIEEEIKDSLEVKGGAEELYYAKANEPVYITVHLNNPDNFEILSFTLNEKRYSNYMFEDGSDMESLILKVDVGNAAGYIDYTIDAIKYVDGTEIKDVIISGDKTVRTGVYTEKQPSVKVNKEEIEFNDIYLELDITDSLSLIEQSQGEIYAYLYDGESLIYKKDISLANNTVKIENLTSNRLYQYAVVALYDNLDGSGYGMHVRSIEKLSSTKAGRNKIYK